MNEKIIYTDCCSKEMEEKIATEGYTVVKRTENDNWNVNEAMRFITDPFLEFSVINRLDSISLMEISLLHFMSKPILVTTRTVHAYPAVVRTVDYIDTTCNLTVENNCFISWLSVWKEGIWN